MTQCEVQRRYEEYQLTRNALIANKFADSKKFCALDDIAPDFTEEIMEICVEVYDQAYKAAIDECFKKIN